MTPPEPTAVLDFVRAHPGCGVDAVAAAVGSTPRVTGYVLRVLRAAGRIRSQGQKRRMSYSAGEPVIPEYAAAIEYVRQNPGCTVHACARSFATTPEITGAVLRVLRAAGLIVSEGATRGVRYWVV